VKKTFSLFILLLFITLQTASAKHKAFKDLKLGLTDRTTGKQPNSTKEDRVADIVSAPDPFLGFKPETDPAKRAALPRKGETANPNDHYYENLARMQAQGQAVSNWYASKPATISVPDIRVQNVNLQAPSQPTAALK